MSYEIPYTGFAFSIPYVRQCRFNGKSDRVILSLGGNIARLDKTIELALKYPTAVVIVSTEGGAS